MNDTAITLEQAREFLGLPSGTRPRVYATVAGGEYAGQVVALRSHQNMDTYGPFESIWLSGTTVDDLVRKA